MERIDFMKASPASYKAWASLERFLAETGLETPLLELVRMRASQINGCAFCMDMHSTDARKGGETEQRLYTLAVWRETPFFTPRERAALAWTEALTKLSQGPVAQADYEALRANFSDSEMVDLTTAINTINGWNRLAVGFGKMPA